MAGEAIFGPQVAASVLSFFATSGTIGAPESDPAFPEPSPRELHILDLLASGQHTATIAERLCLSPKTVSNNLTAIFAKLQVASRAEAIVLARQRGLGGGTCRAAWPPRAAWAVRRERDWPLAACALVASTCLTAGLLMVQRHVSRIAGALLSAAGVVGLF
ncbi:MAG: hypothetical protein QG597_2894 [Actinomycetota bacterium]|nr:hypothetical protein [Actinomycetota bacterium]